jgi:type IV pilus assembly protein PilB
LLLKEERITAVQLQEALDRQKEHGGKLGHNLAELGFVKDDEIASVLSKQYGVPSINLTQFDIDASVIQLVPAATAQKYEIVPVSRDGATLTIAMSDPTNVFAVDDIKFMTGYQVEPVVAAQTALMAAIERYYGNGATLATTGTVTEPSATTSSSARASSRWRPRRSRRCRLSTTTTSKCSKRRTTSMSSRSSGRAVRRRSSVW